MRIYPSGKNRYVLLELGEDLYCVQKSYLRLLKSSLKGSLESLSVDPGLVDSGVEQPSIIDAAEIERLSGAPSGQEYLVESGRRLVATMSAIELKTLLQEAK